MRKNIFEFKSEKEWLSLSFLVFVYIICVYTILDDKITTSFNLDFSNPVSLLTVTGIVYVAFLGLKQMSWILGGKLTIEFNNEKLIVNKKYFFLHFKKKYSFSKISNIETKDNIDSGTSWIFQGIRINDRDKRVILFNYGNKKVKLGTKTTDFKAYEVKMEIENYLQ